MCGSAKEREEREEREKREMGRKKRGDEVTHEVRGKLRL